MVGASPHNQYKDVHSLRRVLGVASAFSFEVKKQENNWISIILEWCWGWRDVRFDSRFKDFSAFPSFWSGGGVVGWWDGGTPAQQQNKRNHSDLHIFSMFGVAGVLPQHQNRRKQHDDFHSLE